MTRHDGPETLDRISAARVLDDLMRNIDLSDGGGGLVQESLAYGLLQGSAPHRAWLLQQQKLPEPSASGVVRMARTENTLTLLLDRPESFNAIDRPMRDALHAGFTIAALDPDITSVRLRGAGRAFCMGADLEEFGTTTDPATAHAIRMQTLPALAIIQCTAKFDVHVQGACVGAGLEMAAFARRFTASSNAWFQLPELAMGLIPGAGGCVSVPRRIGRDRTGALVMSGKRIGARTALDWGLIDAIVDEAPVDHRQTDIVC